MYTYSWLSSLHACMLSHFSHVQLCDPMDCSPSGSSVHGISQARILEWVAMPSSRDQTHRRIRNLIMIQFSSVQLSCSIVSDSLRPHESQHPRPPCPSPTPGVHSDSRPSSQWWHPAISSSVVPFSSCPQSLDWQWLIMFFVHLTEFTECLLFASHPLLSPGRKQWLKPAKSLHSGCSALGGSGCPKTPQSQWLMTQQICKRSSLKSGDLLSGSV